MANTKEYKIVINGITESIDAVKSLEKELFNLEQKIKELESRSVNIKGTSSAGGGGSSRTSKASALTEEEKLEKQILQTEAKREAYSKEIYQNYLASKEALAETVKDQKQLAAAERLSAGAYTNTMKGMKQELADIQEVMQTVDLGDTDQFDKLTKRANELIEALKKIEESYGQFGRNVGNYKSAFDNFDGISVTIAGVTKSFDNLKQASKAIRDEMGKLEYNNQKDTQEYKNLEKQLDKVTKAQLRLNSAMNDAKSSSKAMDDLLDTMESFVALGQVERGFSTFFGLDNSELEKQIAKLVALQNMLTGIEKIRKQMNTKEGLGKWLDISSKSIDKFVAKLAGAEVRMGKIVAGSKQMSINLARLSTVIKVVGGVFAGFVTSAAVEMIGNMISKFKEWYTGGKAAASVTEQLSSAFEILVKQYEKLGRSQLSAWLRGAVRETTYLRDSVNSLVGELTDLLKVLSDVEKVDFNKPRGSILGGIDLGYSGSTDGFWGVPNNGKNQEEAYEKAKARFIELGQMITRYQEKLDKSIMPNWLDNLLHTLDGGGINRIKREYAKLGEDLAQNMIGSFNEVMKKANQDIEKTGEVSEATRTEIRKLNGELNYDMVSGSLLDNIDKFSDKGQFYINQISLIRKEFQKLADAVGAKEFSPDYIAQLRIDGMEQSEEKIKKQNDLNRKKELAEAGDNKEVRKLINKKYETELKEQLKSYRKSKSSEYKQKKKEYTDAENDLAKLRLELMRDGWAKIKKQLELEKEERLKTIEDSGILVKERSKLIEKLYNEEDGKKYLEARKEWSKQVIETYENMYKTIEDIRKQNMQTEVSTANEKTERKRDQDIANSGFFYAKYDDTLRNMKDYYTEVAKIEQDAAKKLNAIRKEELDKQYEFDTQEENLRHKRMADAETTALVMEKLAKYEEEKGVPLVPESAEADWAKFESELQSNLNNMSGELVDAYNKGELNFKDFVELIEKEQDAHNSRMNALQKEYKSNTEQNEKDLTDSMREAENKRFQSLIAQARQKMDELGNVMSQQPIKDEDWGVVNIKKTNENYKKVAEGYKNTTEYLIQLKAELKQKLDNKEITAEDFFARKSELDAAIKASEEATKDIVDKQKDVLGEFLRSIQQYIQAVGQGIQQIMSAVWSAQDTQFDNEARQLDKLNEKLQDAMDKNEEILERHKQNVDSIEDELQTARGARREHLIDQLNAEVIAERRAAAEKKKIEKEQEALKKKQDDLDKKRQEAQYQRELTQILVSGALAAVNAYATKPFVPVGLAMGTLSLGLTAAQYAIAKANPPKFKEGGVIQGKSHTQGGVKVLGGYAEVEGNEYIVNKRTTMQNVEILDYINSKKRRLDISDFIDFYSSDKPRTVIKNMSPKSRFAEGGQIPTLRTDIDISGSLRDAFKEYAKVTPVVQVVDIVDKTKQYNNVRVLAGLE